MTTEDRKIYNREYYLSHKEYYRSKYLEKKKIKITQPHLKDNSLEIVSERDLHLELIRFIKENYPDVLIMSLPIDRIDKNSIPEAMRHGYTKGTPDIMIMKKNNQYSGMAIELKRPQPQLLTKASEEQLSTLNKLQDEGFMCIISNDLLHLVKEITIYLSTTS